MDFEIDIFSHFYDALKTSFQHSKNSQKVKKKINSNKN